MEKSTTAKKYRELNTKTLELPSGAIFTIQRRIGFLPMAKTLSGMGTDWTDKKSMELAMQKPENLTKMMEGVLPEVCIEPKVTADKGKAERKPDVFLHIDEIGMDDQLVIWKEVMDMSSVSEVVKTFRGDESNDSDNRKDKP